MQLRTIRSGLVQDLGGIRPPIDQIVDLLDRQRSRLGKLHATQRRGLDVRRGDGMLGDVLGNLTSAVGELADAERSVGFGGCDDGFESFDCVP